VNSAPESTPLGELFQALGEGLSRPRHEWEFAVVVAAAVLTWLIGRVLRGRRGAARAALPRVLPLLLGLALVVLGESVLRGTHVLAGASEARLLRLAASLFGTMAAVRVLGIVARRAFPQAAWVPRLERLAAVAAGLGVLLYATGLLSDVVDWLGETRIPLGNGAVSFLDVLRGAGTTSLAVLAAMWAGSLVEERLFGAVALAPNLRIVIGRSVRALLLVLAVLVGLSLSGIDLTVLSVFGGALGVGLGLGLQRIASNYVSGFILLLDRGLRIGDVITLEKHTGRVSEIRTRYTVLRGLDGSESILPNEMLISLPVVNHTLGDRNMQLAVRFPLPLASDPRLVLRVLEEAALQPARVLRNPPPAALLIEISGGTIVFEIDFWIGDPENGRMNVQSEVAVAALVALRGAGIEPAAPVSEIRIDGGSPVQLRDNSAEKA